MKQIAQFFTLYWIIYFPTCIAFNDLPGFSSIDEVMTGILVIYTFRNYGKRRITNVKPWKEYFTFIYILLFYIVYSLCFGANVAESVLYDLMQQVRPWSIIYCTWILNPRFSRMQKKWMAYSMLVTLIVFLIYHPETAANAFSEGSEFRSAPFGQLAICTSMGWYLFNDKTKKNIYIATVIAVVGLLGMKFKYYGQFGAWMFMLYYMKGKFSFRSNRMVSTIISLAILAFVVLLLGWERFHAYYIEGSIATDRRARPEMNKALWQILWDYFPFGSGLGSYATAASAVYYSPIWEKYNLHTIWGLQNYGVVAFHCDNFFASFGQIGWAGIYMFYVFWKRRFQQFQRIMDMRYYKVAMMAFFCIFIEWFGDSSFFSGKGMGYCMLIALCLNANRNMGLTDSGKVRPSVAEIEEKKESQEEAQV